MVLYIRMHFVEINSRTQHTVTVFQMRCIHRGTEHIILWWAFWENFSPPILREECWDQLWCHVLSIWKISGALNNCYSEKVLLSELPSKWNLNVMWNLLLMSLDSKCLNDNHQSSYYWSIKYLRKYIQIEINKTKNGNITATC